MGTKKVKPIQIKPNKSNVLLIKYLQIEQVEIRPHKTINLCVVPSAIDSY